MTYGFAPIEGEPVTSRRLDEAFFAGGEYLAQSLTSKEVAQFLDAMSAWVELVLRADDPMRLLASAREGLRSMLWVSDQQPRLDDELRRIVGERFDAWSQAMQDAMSVERTRLAREREMDERAAAWARIRPVMADQSWTSHALTGAVYGLRGEGGARISVMDHMLVYRVLRDQLEAGLVEELPEPSDDGARVYRMLVAA